MEMIIREIQAIQHDVKVMLSHADDYKRDAGDSIVVTFDMEEHYPLEAQLDNAVLALIDAKDDIDRLRDEMKEVLANLDKLVDAVEYETVAEEIR